MDDETPQIVTADAIAAELGARAQAELGWGPRYLDPEEEIGKPQTEGGA